MSHRLPIETISIIVIHLQVVYVATALYGFTLIFLKISLSTFFLRIFVVQRWARIIIYVVLAETISYGLVYIIFSLASCGLNQAFSSNGGTCNQASAFLGITISAGLLNAITDLTFSVMAVIALWPANMSLSTKVIAILILIFGTVGGVASAIRIGYLIGNATRPLDITQSFGGSKWTLIECGIGITAASLATLRPLLRAIIGKAKSSPYSSTSTCANNLVPSALGADNKNNRVPDWREDSIAAPSGPESSDVEKGNGGHTSTGFALSMEGYDDQSSGQVLQTHNLLEGTPSNDHKRTSTIVEEKELCGS